MPENASVEGGFGRDSIDRSDKSDNGGAREDKEARESFERELSNVNRPDRAPAPTETAPVSEDDDASNATDKPDDRQNRAAGPPGIGAPPSLSSPADTAGKTDDNGDGTSEPGTTAAPSPLDTDALQKDLEAERNFLEARREEMVERIHDPSNVLGVGDAMRGLAVIDKGLAGNADRQAALDSLTANAEGAAVMDGVVTTPPREQISLYQSDLRLQRRGLEYQREEMLASSPIGRGVMVRQKELAQIDRQLALNEHRRQFYDSLTTPDPVTGETPTVMAFDPTEDGRIVVAHGDLENATHVAVMVPGMTTDIDNIGDTIEDAKDLRDALSFETSVNPATVTWFDYDAPDFIGEVRHADQAIEAGPRLRDFLNSIGAREDASVSLYGHSYGSTAVGAAARGGPIDVDQVVIMGSVGTLGDSVEDMQLPEGTKVYSVINNGDLAPSFRLHGPVPPDGAVPLPSIGFGHTTYFDNTEALVEMTMGGTDRMAGRLSGGKAINRNAAHHALIVCSCPPFRRLPATNSAGG